VRHPGPQTGDHPSVTLRTRLVIGLLVLATAGLAVFGVLTYSLYARSQYDRLDGQIRAAIPLIAQQLRAEGGGVRGGPGGGRPVPAGPLSLYGELRTADGNVHAVRNTLSSSEPKLPADLHELTHEGRFITVDSTTGGTRWRALVIGNDRPFGSALVVAAPLSDVSAALRRLVAIESASGAVLLVLLGSGSWLILRRGLRPLEAMAVTARSITAGDLSHRVATSDDQGEVGQLGLAINTMLDDIEVAFRERQETEDRLRQFLADASHELRTPLTSIQGFAELFRLEEGEGRVELPTILRRIEEESARMATLVDDLLLLARLDQPRPIDRAPVDVAVLAADACTDAVAADPNRPISLVAPDPVVVMGDRDHLRQAIGNLVTNAVRHTPAGTPVEVTAVLENGAGVVRVRDHGPGLDDDAVVHVFDRFWQADDARVGRGTGLGLAIVAGIAAEHGGRAEAANAPDGGALFTLTVPLSADVTPED
jgi:two-component system, OmpR family, sensor kinase